MRYSLRTGMMRGRSGSASAVSHGWRKIEDSKGVAFSPFGTKIRKFFCLPRRRAKLCKVLNENPDWEIIGPGKVAYQDDFHERSGVGIPLPSGRYYYESTHFGEEYLRPIEMRDDKFVRVPTLTGHIIQDVRDFLKSEEKYRNIGAQYRLGVLLYGPPGNGKTLFIRDLIRNEVPASAITMFWSELPSISFLLAIKRDLKERLKVIVFEELNGLVNRSRIDRMLDFLDGETSLDDTLILATTNYPEQLPGNLVDRPSRFDKVHSLGNPDADARETILQFLLRRNVTPEEIKVTQGLSCADLKEVALLNQVLRRPPKSGQSWPGQNRPLELCSKTA